jgi:DNA-binding beta-propeller fold protein YncE
VLALAGFATAAADAPLVKPVSVIWGYADGAHFNNPRGIAFDPSDGALYVADTGNHQVEVFSKTGRRLNRFVHRVLQGEGAVVDGNPCALAFDRGGRLLVADQLARYVDVMDRRARAVARLETPGGRPSALAVGGDGTIFVGTSGEESKIYRFRPDYQPLGSWGEEGTDPGHLFGITALGVLGDSAIAVVCSRTDRAIQMFTPAGTYLRGFGVHDVGNGNVSLPSGMIVTADGRIWVADEIRETIQVYDKDGNYVEKTGESGVAPGEFSHPSSLASDGRGLIALTDRGIGRVQVLAIRGGQEGTGLGQH